MKALQYKRKEINGEIKSYVGVYAKAMSKYNTTMLHPAEEQCGRLYVCRGLLHTNAFDIKEIEVNLLDMANGRNYEEN